MDKRVNLLFVILMSITSMGWAQLDSLHGVRTVVIDPGHGGKDPGCSGKAGAKEKHVCLAIGLKLGEAIKKMYPDVKVIYTRKTDVFVELDERANIANKADADLFICIHANSASPSAHGAETYVLGLHRADDNLKVVEEVMKRENSVIQLEENTEVYKGSKYQMDEEWLALYPYLQAVMLENSRKFATQVQKQFADLGRKDRGVRQAGFLVLRATGMPGVLIETGFLTNAQEEAFLKSEANQLKMASAIFTAFKSYKTELDSVASVVNTNMRQKEEPKQVEPVWVEDSTGIVFRVQIETSSTKLALDAPQFKGRKVHMYTQNGLYKYTLGYFRDYEDAADYQKKVRQEGYESAFTVALENGKRINLNDARKKAKM